MFLSSTERVPEWRSRATGGRHSQVDGGGRSEGARGRHDRGHAGRERMALNVKRTSIWNFTWSQWRGCKTGAMWSSQETVTRRDERGCSQPRRRRTSRSLLWVLSGKESMMSAAGRDAVKNILPFHP